jgi:hypothetical protein
LAYLEEVDNVDIDDDERLVDEMDDAITDGDVGFDHLGHDNASRMMEIAHQGVGLHVHYRKKKKNKLNFFQKWPKIRGNKYLAIRFLATAAIRY